MRFSLQLFALWVFAYASVYPLSSHASVHTKAPHAVVFEYGSNTILFERNIDTPTHTASMSKLMTLYIVFRHLQAGTISLGDTFQVSKTAHSAGTPSAFLRAGQYVTVKDLIRGAAVVSGNDACITLAEGLYISQEQFVEEMNKVAKALDLKNSSFVNVTGWPGGNKMSVRDMLTLANRILHDFPEYYSIFGEKQFSYNGIVQKSYNTLLNYNNVEVDGIKTGHTKDWGYGIIASAVKDGRRVVVVVNGLQTETERAYEVKKLISYAFNRFGTKTVFEAGSIVGEVPVSHRRGVTLPVYVSEDVVATYPKSMEHNIKAFISAQEDVSAPIEKGQRVGTLTIRVRNTLEYKFPVYASKSIYPRCRICHYVKSLFHKKFGK
ncbi:D-alanyl-D-alanine carboxypeptidase [Candidatus Anaplasma sp. TIGMIC]|nr:D-alanyl-D-alanine carboxypeptidase family protein [Candidatus Anaplasma sp. TIGMIC]MDB1135318.1 D-alanyl-D-alanine carboxypeptidase [Candidatus Anaplasma sp. TIGMIC]